MSVRKKISLYFQSHTICTTNKSDTLLIYHCLCYAWAILHWGDTYLTTMGFSVRGTWVQVPNLFVYVCEIGSVIQGLQTSVLNCAEGCKRSLQMAFEKVT